MSLDRIWNAIQQFLNSRTASPVAREIAEIRHDILDQIRGNIQELSAAQFLFPFSRILIELRPRTPAERAAIQTIWIDRGELGSDILVTLKRADCEYSKDLAVEVRFRDDLPESDSTGIFR